MFKNEFLLVLNVIVQTNTIQVIQENNFMQTNQKLQTSNKIIIKSNLSIHVEDTKKVPTTKTTQNALKYKAKTLYY